jgi:hypothetical protein
VELQALNLGAQEVLLQVPIRLGRQLRVFVPQHLLDSHQRHASAKEQGAVVWRKSRKRTWRTLGFAQSLMSHCGQRF